MTDAAKASKLRLSAISMVRNEADIVHAFMRQMSELFDQVMIVDVQSTDGTVEALAEIAKLSPDIEIYSCNTQERYQSAMMNHLARKAVSEGADWVFFLDADEFVDVESKSALHAYLRDFPHDVMHMPWVNLIPTRYGQFGTFEVEQDYVWSGRISQFRKVAISCLYMNAHPDFYVQEGNHNVSHRHNSPAVAERLGLCLLHLPVRSADRLKYKLSNAQRLMDSKHNNGDGEGLHVTNILNVISEGRVRAENLNAIVAQYGLNEQGAEELDPREFGWPAKSMPDYLFSAGVTSQASRGLAETLVRDAAQRWEKPSFVKGSEACAQIVGSEIRIICQPMKGNGAPYNGRYATLPGENSLAPEKLSMNVLIDAMSTTFLRPDVIRFSAWSRLIPVLFALFCVQRPRRYVELGVHNGMSFFAACQAAKHLDLKTECIAVDSWIGDPHASFHSSEIFDQFRSTIGSLYPQHHYIRGFFSDALQSFDDGSVDLLHIDGYHTYEAVKDDFETWLPKMSKTGVIIFHDINVHERGFGVWRFWSELAERFPAFGLRHSHGLGILYVGDSHSPVAEILSMLDKNPDYAKLAQQYFEMIGEASIERSPAVETQIQRAEQPARDEERLSDGTPVPLTAQQRLGLSRRSLIPSRLRWYRNRRDRKIIADSGLFDSQYYLGRNADVRAAGIDPILHYVRYGVLEFRNPNPEFDTAGYLYRNKDVFQAGINPFVHYIKHGKSEQRT
jgi:glycosyltransferase involved in cell wall biosynthesis